MHIYNWRARGITGRLYTGEYLADSEKEVATFLHENYAYITSISENKSIVEQIRKIFFKRTISDKERSMFFGQLAVMLKSGISLYTALNIIRKRDSLVLFPLCEDVIKKLQSGVSFAKSLEEQNGLFSEAVIAIVIAGEQGGILEEMFDELASYYEERVETTRFFRNICLYPLLIIFMSLITFSLFIIKLLPIFSELYQSFGVEPTSIVQVLLMLRNKGGDFWPITLVFLGGLIYFLIYKREKIILKITLLPIVKKYQQAFLEIRFCRMLAMLLKSGITLPVAIETAGNAIANPFLRGRSKVFAQGIVSGMNITKAAKLASPLLSSLTMEFLLIGENSGSLELMFKESAKILEAEFTSSIKDLKVVFEPLLLIIIAFIVMIMLVIVVGPLLSLLMDLPEY